MPSKAKKQSKTPSQPSSSHPSASPRTPSVTSLASDVNEEDLRFSLEETSSRYPSLIEKSAFIGRVKDVDSESRGYKIWLLETFMVAASLTPSSIVSVIYCPRLDAKLSKIPSFLKFLLLIYPSYLVLGSHLLLWTIKS